MTAAADHQKAVRQKSRCVRQAAKGINIETEMRKARNTGCGYYPTSAGNSRRLTKISHLAVAHKKVAAAPRMNSNMFQPECEE